MKMKIWKHADGRTFVVTDDAKVGYFPPGFPNNATRPLAQPPWPTGYTVALLPRCAVPSLTSEGPWVDATGEGVP